MTSLPLSDSYQYNSDFLATKNHSAKSKYRSRLALVGLSSMIFLSACTSNLKNLPKEAQINVPDQWQSIEVKKTASVKSESSEKPELDVDISDAWLNSFADEQLQQHVQTALLNNPDLWSSATQLKSAIEQVRITGSRLWPSITADLNSNRTDNDTNGVTTEIRTVSAAMDVSWEADIWGKLTQRKRADIYNAQAQSELFKAAELSLVANVSRAWYNLVTNKLQLDLAEKSLESFQSTAALIEENYQRGLRSALDVYLSRSDVEVQVAQLADSQFEYIQAQRALKTLLGEYPNATMNIEAKLPELSASVAAGLPAELLTRRPDIKASQLQYKASRASASAAQRDLYPSLSFNGSIGDSRERFNQLFDADNMVMTLASGLVQPIFSAGALRSRANQAGYQAEAAYANLVSTTLTAFQEVENALSQEASLLEQRSAIAKAVDFAQGGLDLALDRYQSGLENYTTVLESQRRLFDSSRSQINIQNALVQNRISIHLALGGNFTEPTQTKPEDNLPSIPPKSDE